VILNLDGDNLRKTFRYKLDLQPDGSISIGPVVDISALKARIVAKLKD
jgi:hypothetical protein